MSFPNDQSKVAGAIPVYIASMSYPSSTGNNTTAQLANGATFTGAIETAQAQESIQISVVCDTSYTLVLEQFEDAAGLKLCGSKTWTKLAGVTTNVCLPIVANFCRIKITNTSGGAATTTLASNVTFGPMAAIDDNGNLPVAIHSDTYTITETVVTVPATAGGILVVAANPNRKYLLIQNNGAQDARLAPGTTCAITAGQVLAGLGAGMQGGGQEWPHGAPTNAFAAITAVNTTTFTVWEG